MFICLASANTRNFWLPISVFFPNWLEGIDIWFEKRQVDLFIQDLKNIKNTGVHLVGRQEYYNMRQFQSVEPITKIMKNVI